MHDLAYPVPPLRQMVGGLLLTSVIAAAGLWLGTLPFMVQGGFSALTLAIVLGMLLGNAGVGHLIPHAAAGVDFSRTRLLQLGIVLYGFRITFGQIAQVGWTGLAIDTIMVSSTFLLALLLGRKVLRMDDDTVILIGAGASICGAAAVMGTEPVVRAHAHKVSIAVATVVVFGTVSMFLYPSLYPFLGLDDYAYGIYVGSTVHEVAQVVVAGTSVSDSAAGIAVIEKMLRVMLLAPFLLLLSGWLARRDSHRKLHVAGRAGHPIAIPWFVLGFIAVSGFNTLQRLPASVVQALVDIDTFVLAMAMAALGLRTQAGALRQAGIKPLLLAAALMVYLVAGGYTVNRLVLSHLQ